MVAYDGTNYCGWQVQPNGNTIQAELTAALEQLLRHRVSLIGASRTDSGVHARGNVCVFDTTVRMPAEKMSYALNTYLPPDIRIQDSCEVPLTFHPRFCRTVKTYEYRILNRRFADPCQRLYSYFCYRPLNVEAMREAAGYLTGTHDFTSFCTHKPDVTDHVRTIMDFSILEEDGLITLRITGNGFLYNMVRIIAGTLIRVGIGDFEPSYVKEALEARDREMAGETARPEGLTLIRIEYPDGYGSPDPGSREAWGET